MQQLASSALMAGLRMQQEADQNEADKQKPTAAMKRGSTVGGGDRLRSSRGSPGDVAVAAPKPAPRPLDNLRSSHERVAAVGAALVHLWQQQREIEAYLPNQARWWSNPTPNPTPNSYPNHNHDSNPNPNPNQGPFFVAAGSSLNVPCYLRWSGKRLLQRRWPKRDTENMVEDIWKNPNPNPNR